jgi:hypothetical protein
VVLQICQYKLPELKCEEEKSEKENRIFKSCEALSKEIGEKEQEREMPISLIYA